MATHARGYVEVSAEECKGCGLCIEACPPKCLLFARELSAYGVHPVKYSGDGCTACGICFYCCPEPGAITVYRATPLPRAAQELSHAGTLQR